MSRPKTAAAVAREQAAAARAARVAAVEAEAARRARNAARRAAAAAPHVRVVCVDYTSRPMPREAADAWLADVATRCHNDHEFVEVSA